MNETAKPPRGTSPLQKAVEAEVVQRRDMRPDLRDDPRERARKRAAEVRNNVGTMDEGLDEFYVDPKDIPAGWCYEWKRKTLLGAEDPAYQVSLARMGWEPVPADRIPSMMPGSGTHAAIERKGMILMERPQELTDEAHSIELRRARFQMQTKKEQLGEAKPGQFTRDHAQVKPRINNSYEPIPIPEE